MRVSQRLLSHFLIVGAAGAPHLQLSSVVEIGQPSQRLQPRREEVLTAAQRHELWQSLEAPADGLLRDGEDARPVVRPNERIPLGGRANEGAPTDPPPLDGLELAPQGV